MPKDDAQQKRAEKRRRAADYLDLWERHLTIAAVKGRPGARRRRPPAGGTGSRK